MREISAIWYDICKLIKRYDDRKIENPLCIDFIIARTSLSHRYLWTILETKMHGVSVGDAIRNPYLISIFIVIFINTITVFANIIDVISWWLYGNHFIQRLAHHWRARNDRFHNWHCSFDSIVRRTEMLSVSKRFRCAKEAENASN